MTLPVCLVYWIGLLGLSGCGTVDPGERSLAGWRVVPDAQLFGSEVHPLLNAGCSAKSCHGGEVSFKIHQASALADDAGVGHPSQLPEPIRTDYYTVLAYSDPEIPENSLFLLWEAGSSRPHPEKGVLAVDERHLILQWLRGENEP